MLATSAQAAGSGVAAAHLHPVHGLPQLVQLVGRAQGFQANVRQLHLLVPQLVPQLHHRLGLAVRALRDTAGHGQIDTCAFSHAASPGFIRGRGIKPFSFCLKQVAISAC